MKKTHVYKNISGMPQDLMGYGHVEAGATVETSDIIYNGNFEEQDAPAPAEKPSEPEKPKKDK